MTKSGVVSTTSSSIFICSEKNGSSIVKMRFTNADSYTLNISLYTAKTKKTITLYDLVLDAGDTVTDNLKYELEQGDQLIASSNRSKTFYTLNVE